MTTPKLETDRLILRKVHSDDIEAIFGCWMQDEEVSKYMWWKASDDINKAKEFVEFELAYFSSIMMKNTGISPIILERSSGGTDM